MTEKYAKCEWIMFGQIFKLKTVMIKQKLRGDPKCKHQCCLFDRQAKMGMCLYVDGRGN